MTEMNEAEVLAEVALETWRGGPSFEVAADMCNRIAVAVAAKARELDAARGGVLVASAVKAWLDNVEANGTGVGLIRDHLAAQGRTIAGLERKVLALEHVGEGHEERSRGWMAQAEDMQAERDEARATIAEKDARIAELRAMLASTESTLATLRQAVDDAVRAIIRGEFGRAETILNATKDATPTEHPDTAMLRAIRERASDNAALGRIAMERTGLEGEVAVAVRDYLLGDSGPSGGGEMKPTTPPDVAASEHPVATAAREAMQRGGAKWAAGGMDGEPAPTHEEDLRTVEEAIQSYRRRSLDGDLPSSVQFADDALAALARLKDAPRRAAERMRHRADVAVLMLQPPASLLCQCETSAEANAVRGAWCAAINAAVDAIRALEVTP